MTTSSTPIHVFVNEMWQKLNELGNEMMVTKAGRCFFPLLDYSITGLEPDAKYSFEMRLERDDAFKHNFAKNGRWLPMSDCKIEDQAVKVVSHPDGAKKGSEWMEEDISFDFVKITSSTGEKRSNYIIVQSMCKYNPVLAVFKHSSDDETKKELIGEMKFDFTKFYAVTGYHNPALKKMKMENNPACSFRSKRRLEPQPEESQLTSTWLRTGTGQQLNQ